MQDWTDFCYANSSTLPGTAACSRHGWQQYHHKARV